MNQLIDKQSVKNLIGQHIYAVRKDGTTVQGRLVRLKGNELVLQAPGGKNVRTSAIIPLVLFDLLAIGTIGAWGGGGWGGGGWGGGGWGGPGGFQQGPFPGPGPFPGQSPYGGGGYFW